MLEKLTRRRAAQGLRDGHGPPLRTMANVAAKRVGRNHPGGRRAGCPHPAGPRGGANVSVLKLPWCGGRERPPYKFGKTRRPPRRIHAAARSPGRIWNPPLQPTAGLQPPAKSRTPHCCNLCRGRCLHRPGQPRGGAGSRGRIWNPPLRPRAGPVGNRETAFPRHAAHLVGADSISARPAAAQGLREGHGPPLQTTAYARAEHRGLCPTLRYQKGKYLSFSPIRVQLGCT